MSLTFFFKDKNLKPENIRKGVKIGKVLGTLEGGGGSGNNQDITADSSTLEQTITFEDGYDGIGIFTLLPYTLQSKTVNSSTSSQTVTPDQGYDGLSSVTVNPYALESKTVNSSTSSQTVTPSQGYNGLYRVLVNPYVLDTKSLDPSTVSQTVNSSVDGMSSVSVSAVTSSIDSNIQAGNIKDGVTILGVTGNMASGDWVANLRKGDSDYTDASSRTLTVSENDPAYKYAYLFYGTGNTGFRFTPPVITGNRTSNYELYSAFHSAANIRLHNIDNEYKIVLPFTTTGNYALSNMFYQASFYDYDGKISFPNLTSIGVNGMEYFLYNTNTTIRIEMPVLSFISNYGLYKAFSNSRNVYTDLFSTITYIGQYGLAYAFDLSSQTEGRLTTVSFNSLQNMQQNNCMLNTFTNRTNLTSVSFPVLTNISSDSAMKSCFQNCTGLTSVSFPELTTVNGSDAMQNCFKNCTGLTSVSFPKLTTVNGMRLIFSGCTNLTSVSFPELTTITGNYGFTSAFEACTSLTSLSFPKLESITGDNPVGWLISGAQNITSVSFPKVSTLQGNSAYILTNNGGLTTAVFHPKLISLNNNKNFAYATYGQSTNNIANLTLSENATFDIYLNWSDKLTAASVLSVLTHLDLNTSSKSCTFYSGGLTVTDDAQGTLQTAYDAAVNAGWTISNLTITPYTP